MSLILEALRKSEAERRRGRMPDLHAELPPAPFRAASATAWPWRIVLAAAALLALAAWLAASTWRAPAAVTAAPPSTVVTTPPALPRVSRLQPMPQARRSPARTVAEPGVTQSAAIDRTLQGPAAPMHAVGAGPDASAPTRVAATAAAADAAAHTTTQPVVAIPPPSHAIDSMPMQLSDLAPEERKALPPLRLSMHLWNDDPSLRFVILDGTRLGEGDRIGSLVVTAIVRDGVLLDWNGRALKVPLR